VTRHPKLRVLFPALPALTFAACTGGVNAGEKGGTAFIYMAAMLVAICVVLWVILGRGE
jgi:hypothetical protein